jgi:hypothetical protein
MRPKFNGKPIASVDALARALNLSEPQLRTLAGSASYHYREFSLAKRDGTLRFISGPTEELKTIQQRINRQIFERVEFPEYLFGSIKERCYIQNATLHAHAQVAISLDVKNYFPSIKRAHVLNIYKNFFNFREDVAEVLTDLCTKNGEVPQGACTSSYLANLALFDVEHRLVYNLSSEGLTYSRLIDDITISSRNLLSKSTLNSLIERVASLLKTKGFKLKRSKTKISSRTNKESPIEITGLRINLGKPSAKKQVRVNIRKEVRQCIEEANYDIKTPEYHNLHNKTSGRVAMLSQLKHPEAKRYRKTLKKIQPIYTKKEVAITEKIVSALCKTPLGSRYSPAYIKRFYQAQYRVNITKRTDAELAKNLQAKLNSHKPLIVLDKAIHGK